MQRLPQHRIMPALFGTPAKHPPADVRPGTPGLAALSLLEGVQRAELVLLEVHHGTACANLMRDVMVELMSDPAALEGACRVLQAALAAR